MKRKPDEVEVVGDVFVVKAACLDSALWKIGGAAVALKLVQLAKVCIRTWCLFGFGMG
jgi:hypothetical protein